MAEQDPLKLSSAAVKMSHRVAMMSALMGGTEAMRAAGKKYLPQYDAESDANYDYRLQRSVLLNLFKRAVDMLAGKPFSKPIQTADFVPELEPLIEDVDCNGNHLHIFARTLFQDALVHGITHVLVEYPDVAAAQPANLEEERQLAARPYFCHVPHCTIIAAYSETVNGSERLTHVRLLEEELVREGFGERTVVRVRVLEPGKWELWRKEGKRWIKEREGTTTISEIPLVTFYAEREDFMMARPPLSDLADLNIAHWQSSSDQRNILTLTRFPLLAARGVNDEESNVKIGPNKLLTSISKDGEFYYVEHGGAAIAAGRTDLEDLKAEMAIIAADLLHRSGGITATEKAIDTAQSNSTLQDMASRFGDFLERCFGIAGNWIGLVAEEYGSVTVNSDFGLTPGGTAEYDTLIKLRDMREISHAQFIIELKRRSFISDDFDVEADRVLMQEEEDYQLEQDMVRSELMGLNPDGTPIEPTQTAT